MTPELHQPPPGGAAPARWRLGDDPDALRFLLRRGGVAAVPTESSYGLATDPRSRRGVEAIYRIKQREGRKPLPLVVRDQRQASDLGIDVTSEAFRFGLAHWPAPLTVLVPFDASRLALGELATVAVRIPSHPPLLELLESVGHGLTSTSANLSGEPAITDAGGAERLLAGHDAMVVDSPRLPGGAPSTVVAWEAGRATVLRHGAHPLAGTDAST